MQLVEFGRADRRSPRPREAACTGFESIADVRPGIGQEGLEHGLGGPLVNAMGQRGRARREGLFEKRLADPFHAPQLAQRLRRPVAVPEHLAQAGSVGPG